MAWTGRYPVSPRYGELTSQVTRTLDARRYARITQTEFLRRMRRLGYTATPAWNMLGEWERGEITFEEYGLPPRPEATFVSRQDNNETSNRGKITIDRETYDLPATVSLDEGRHTVTFDPAEGYVLATPAGWETTGDVSIVLAAGALYYLTVRGDGEVAAVYTVTPVKDCRLWTFTRYYKYVSRSGRPWNNRHFELTLVLPFLADWTEEDVRKVEDAIIDLCDKIMQGDVATVGEDGSAFAQKGYYAHTWEDILADIRAEELVERDWARGWERGRDPEKFDTSKAHQVDWEIEDKQGHYWRGVAKGTVYWDIPAD